MYKSKGKIKFELILACIRGLAIPAIFIGISFEYYHNAVNEFLLISSKTVRVMGLITDAKEFEDYVATNNDRSTERVLNYSFDYSFNLPDGTKESSMGDGDGELPEFLIDVKKNPVPIEVDYLPNNPKVSRINALWTGDKTLLDWFRHKVIGLLVFPVCFYFGYKVINSGIKDYFSSLSEYKKMEDEYYSMQKIN